ncbi:MAG: site-specific DNA-methyltransferase [Richelia sp. RM2_1_2]|nr:site-specific DNA-methyltransferase [Richelia sp. RM2_1_2]
MTLKFETPAIKIYLGDSLEILPTLTESVFSCVTSPPYAEQRAKFYSSISETEYPTFTLAWMDGLKPFLDKQGSVLINIRENISKGEISDYVLRTRLKLRENAWRECEELIWVKPDGPPVGNMSRPRRSWERILWFSKTTTPYCDATANGNEVKNLRFDKSQVGQGLKQWCAGYTNERTYTPPKRTRCRDYVEIPVSKNSRFKDTEAHPATFPIALAEWMIKLVSREGDTIIDPFMGSGTVGIACINLNRKFIGIDNNENYINTSIKRLTSYLEGH